MKGNSHHWVSKQGNKVGTDVGGGGNGGSGKWFIISFLESAVIITIAKVRETNSSAIGEIREKRWKAFRKGEV
jgi:hypothetical protein